MRKFKTDFLTFIILSKISVVHICYFRVMFETSIKKKQCLKILIDVLVLVLCKKTGRFL